MRRLSALVIFASLAWFAPATHAESHNPADYPLCIHVYRRIDVFKQWMAKHDYDPEHGKDTPTRTAPENTPAAANPAGAAPSSSNSAVPPQ